MANYVLPQLWILLAGFAGAVLPVAMQRERERQQAVVRIVCGSLVAIFMAPAVQRYWLPAEDIEVQAGVSFLAGCFGLRVTIIVQRLLDRHGEGILSRALSRIEETKK
jgi:hypothetical protein